MAAGMPMANPSPQPMGALQHETMMQQQLAAAAAAAVAAQQSVAPEGVAAPRVPQPALNPQQQQVLAAHLQMQAQQGLYSVMCHYYPKLFTIYKFKVSGKCG